MLPSIHAANHYRVASLSHSSDKIGAAIKAEKLMLTKLPGEFIPTKAAASKKPPVRPPQFSKTGAPRSSSVSSTENRSKPTKRPLSPSTSSESSSVLSVKQKHGHGAGGGGGFSKMPPTKQPKLELETTMHLAGKGKFAESSYSSDDNLDDEEEEDVEDEDMDDEEDESDESEDESSGSFVLRKIAKVR